MHILCGRRLYYTWDERKDYPELKAKDHEIY